MRQNKLADASIPFFLTLTLGSLLLFAVTFPLKNNQSPTNIDQSNAAASPVVLCQTGTAPFSIQNPPGYTFSNGCITKDSSIYTDDNRFTFFGAPSSVDNAYYVRTGNLREKGDTSLNWSINLSTPSQLYVLYRKIPGQTVPSWLQPQFYTKESDNNFTNLQQFTMRKNDQGLIGLYDIYHKNGNSQGIVQFGPASDSTVTAYSMYLVAVRPTSVQTPPNTATPTAIPSKTPSSTPVQTPPPSGQAGLPSSILNLTNWKITLPTGSSGSPTEIKQPALASFKIDPWFTVVNGGVRFRAPVNGVTTSGSSYPRSELREMINNGTANAAWSSTSGTHTMTVETQPMSLPATKPQIVLGQIHDASDDISVWRLEDTTLWITDGNTTHGYSVDTNVTLGKRITIKFEVSGGVIKYYYNGNLLPYTQKKSFSGAYFKAGVYTQANCSNSSPCSATNYGEAIIYNVNVTHQ